MKVNAVFLWKPGSKISLNIRFPQDNHSKLTRVILYRLHYQIENTQGKLVRSVVEEMYDVAVDMRKSTSTLGDIFCTK